jgi:hypothetical protein
VEAKAAALDDRAGDRSSSEAGDRGGRRDAEPPAADRPRLSIPARLTELFRRLDRLPLPHSAGQAFDELNTTLEKVEDESSGVPRNPDPGLTPDGRMYPPREDHTNRLPDGGISAQTKGHNIEIAADGATRITSRRTGDVVYERPAGER